MFSIHKKLQNCQNHSSSSHQPIKKFSPVKFLIPPYLGGGDLPPTPYSYLENPEGVSTLFDMNSEKMFSIIFL